MTVNPKRFGQEVRRRRLLAGLSQAGLAEKVGARTNSIARLERGELGPSLSMAQALAIVFRCRIEDLITGKGGKR